MSSELPPLPEPEGFTAGKHNGALYADNRRSGKNFSSGAMLPLYEWFSADQMRAYAEQVRAEERERIARHFDERDNGAGGFYEPHEPAEIIRALTPASPPTHPATG